MENEAKKPLELYIHIPFCVKKCDYCDFLSGPAGKERQREYFQALEREIAAVPDFSDREITTVFIGGGTPSVPDPSLVGEMLDQIRNKFFVAPDAEITIEANPGTLYKEKLQIYLEHGINRLSLGLQSPQNRELKILGRIHTWEEFQESFFMARDAGFSNINIDLMSAIPEQTYADWEKNLRTVAGLSPEHISAYSLIIEEGTPFYEKYEDDIKLLKSLHMDSFRTSMQWSRLLTKDGKLNQEGAQFYHKVCKCAKENQIELFMNLYHFDMPTYLFERGGWESRDVVEAYAAYARAA